MKSLCLFVSVLTVFTLYSCGGRKPVSHNVGGDTISLKYAANLLMVDYDDYTLVKIRNPWDTLHTLRTYLLVDKNTPKPAYLPEGTIVNTPLSKVLLYSSVHCSLLKQLDVLQLLGGICDLNYINIEEIHELVKTGQIIDCGDALNPDMEAVIELHPDAIWLSPFENSGGYGLVEKLNIPIVECADYMENTPLGRAEWMRFYGRLVGAEIQADSLFALIEDKYLDLKNLAASTKSRLSILPDLKTGSTWYMPGGNSYVGQYFRDASIAYAFADDIHSGSIPLPFETVFDKAGNADIWLFRYNNPNHDITYENLKQDYVGYTALKAYKERRVFACNTARVNYYEEAPFRPDYLLGDYIQIFHPEVGDLGGLRYFCPLK